MPWLETSPMEQRVDFVRECASGLFTMTELAAQYGISRKTGYKWLDRHDTEGVLGLQDRSRRPHHSPHATEPALIEALVAVRKRHPRWGAKKLLTVAAAAGPGRLALPPRCRPFEGGRLDPRAVARQPPPAPRAAPRRSRRRMRCGPRISRRVSHRRSPYCYPFTLRDGFSRFVLRCDALHGQPRRHAACFERAFAEYGLPDRIRSDNGPPFGGPGLGRLSQAGGLVDAARDCAGADRARAS